MVQPSFLLQKQERLKMASKLKSVRASVISAIEGDNKIVIQALEGTIQIPWQIQHVLDDILVWRNQGVHFTIKHIFREVK